MRVRRLFYRVDTPIGNPPLILAVTPQELQRLRRNLLRWYERHGRDLPWRRPGDPYRVWLSEIMLQQTTVAAVVPYYERFLARFPTVSDLAAADESEVLRLWEGLGYYTRARNMHRTARVIAGEFGGSFPQTVDQLQALPGVGRYTAGAIASFAFDQRAPIVEANTLRLHSRLVGYADDPKSSAGQAVLWNFAERVLPRTSPGRFNQALMDLGATVCTPETPRCETCPLKSCCAAFADGLQHSIPHRAERPRPTAVTDATAFIRRDGRVLLRQRLAGERWAGLWDFPRYTVSGGDEDWAATGSRLVLDGEPDDAQVAASLAEKIRTDTGANCLDVHRVTTFKHTVTRYRIALHCFAGEAGPGRLSTKWRWIPRAALDDYALSKTGRKLASLLS